MGCIMTPMPNHLSTCLSLPLNHIRVVNMKGNEQCGDGERCGNHTTQETKNTPQNKGRRNGTGSYCSDCEH